MLAVIIGVLLLTAAGLKLYGLSYAPVPRSGVLSSASVQTALVAWEILLGIWLLSGSIPALSWAAAVATFLAFAGVSSYYGLIGQASCGCFGTIQASPWHAFAADLIIFSALVFIRPTLAEIRFALRPAFRRIAPVGLGAAALIVMLALAGTLAYGSVEDLLAHLRGRPIGFSEYVDFGTVRAGTTAEKSIAITNYSDRSVRLIGGTSDCSCVTTSQMPVTIPPGESTSIILRLNTPTGKGGSFTRTADLWTDAPGMVKLRLTLACFLNGG